MRYAIALNALGLAIILAASCSGEIGDVLAVDAHAIEVPDPSASFCIKEIEADPSGEATLWRCEIPRKGKRCWMGKAGLWCEDVEVER